MRIARSLDASSRDSMSRRYTCLTPRARKAASYSFQSSWGSPVGHGADDDLPVVTEPVGDRPENVLIPHAILVSPDVATTVPFRGRSGATAPQRPLAKQLDFSTRVHGSTS